MQDRKWIFHFTYPGKYYPETYEYRINYDYMLLVEKTQSGKIEKRSYTSMDIKVAWPISTYKNEAKLYTSSKEEIEDLESNKKS